MRKLLINIAEFAPQNISALVLIVAGGVWLAVWYTLLSDVIWRPRSGLWKVFWLPVCSIPILGGILYSLVELVGADWRAAFAFRQHDATDRRKGKKQRARSEARKQTT